MREYIKFGLFWGNYYSLCVVVCGNKKVVEADVCVWLPCVVGQEGEEEEGSMVPFFSLSLFTHLSSTLRLLSPLDLSTFFGPEIQDIHCLLTSPAITSREREVFFLVEERGKTKKAKRENE